MCLIEKCDKLYSFKGWKRELVFRTIEGEGRKCDVYYYAPTKKKLASRMEVKDYLMKNLITDLEMDHFTFMHEPLGGDPTQEAVRDLDVRSDESPFPKLKAPPLRPVQVNSPKKETRAPRPPRDRMRPKQEEVQKEAPQRPKCPETRPKAPEAREKRPKRASGGDSLAYATHLYPANPPLTEIKIITPMANYDRELRFVIFYS